MTVALAQVAVQKDRIIFSGCQRKSNFTDRPPGGSVRARQFYRILAPVKKNVSIQGLGLITPLGVTASSNWEAIRADHKLIDRGVISDQILQQQETHYGPYLRLDRFGNITPDRVIRLGLIAACQALAHAGWLQARQQPDTALFVATSKGPILSNLEAYRRLREAGPASVNTSLAWHVGHGPAAIALAISAALNLQVHTTCVGACAGALIAIHYARLALVSGYCQRALVVAADASLHPILENSFDNLGVLAPREMDGHRRCHPFAPQGGGFFISEGAAAICLERTQSPGDLILANSWTGADATHLVRTDPRAGALIGGLNTFSALPPPDFIHAHAAGTHGDLFELSAIRHVFGVTPEVFSSKQWLGHALGAAGLISLTLSALCHQRQQTLPGNPLPPTSRSITIGQGFGGHIALCDLKSNG